MPSVIELINANLPRINKSVDLTLSTVSSTGEIYVDGLPDPALNRFFPIVNYPDPKLAMLKFKSSKPTLAYIVATDGTVPADTERLQLTQELFGNFKLAKGYLVTEADMEVMREVDMMAATGQELAAEQIRMHYLAMPASLSQGCINLHTMLTLRTACAGRCYYYDETTKIPADLSYVAQIPNGNLAAALTGNSRWSQWATANGINDIVAHMQVVYDNIKRFPPFIVMSRTEANNLRNQASTKEVVYRAKGIITEVGTPNAAAIAALTPPSLTDIADVIGQRLLAGGGQNGSVQIIVTDAVYYVRSAGGITQAYPYLPAGYYIFAWDNYIERAIVPTASNNFAGGLSVKARVTDDEPPQERITVAGRGFPLAPDARLIAARNVEDSAIILPV
jgi:hypothetical protein